MYKRKIYKLLLVLSISLAIVSCKAPAIESSKANLSIPEAFFASKDTNTIGTKTWKDFFKDQYLTNLIDVALQNNQELKITLQEI